MLAEAADALPANIPGSQALAVLAELETRRGRLELARPLTWRGRSPLSRAPQTCGPQPYGWPEPFSRSPTAAPRTSARSSPSAIRRTPVTPSSFFPSTRTRCKPRQSSPLVRARAATKRPSRRRSAAPRRCSAMRGRSARPRRGRSDPRRRCCSSTPSSASSRRHGHEPRPDADRWARQAEACGEAGWPFGAAYSHLREAEAALAAALPRARVAEALAAGRGHRRPSRRAHRSCTRSTSSGASAARPDALDSPPSADEHRRPDGPRARCASPPHRGPHKPRDR